MFLIKKQKLAFSFTKERFFHSFFLEFSTTVTIAKLISSGEWYLDSAACERTILFSLSLSLSFIPYLAFLRLISFYACFGLALHWILNFVINILVYDSCGIMKTLFLSFDVLITQIFYRSNRPEAFCKKSFLKNFAKYTGRHLC